ncbi:MAG: RecQ family ATP-dependent DNA helicase [Cyclobacteriaceae bacterium]|nr:RecQ family ATP-dependent DNA helicase [Cyclobacteriaceae bacterium HetDA_MAG_MS6]
MSTRSLEILKQFWGHTAFRPQQEEIIDALLGGKDTLALLPTGGGKSICFQIPGLILDGITLVISPLIALMKDQVDQLNQRGIQAVALYSGMSRREIDIQLDNCVYGKIKFLYISPERLQSPLFLARAEKMQISLLAIDEAHCISQWGYDFRPAYLDIAAFKKEFEIKKVMALTASATKQVRQDIIDKLELQDVQVFQRSFARINLSYSVFKEENKEKKLMQVLNNVPGTAIVYVRNRKRTQVLAEYLQRLGISAAYYHAGMSGSKRATVQKQWIEDQVRVMVATNAFGMGIDKPNVRAVVHLDLPDSLEAYYQEAGRAGRDEKKSFAVIIFNDGDIQDLTDRTERASVNVSLIKQVYQALANQYKLAIGSLSEKSFDFNYQRFVATYQLPVFETFYALKKMEEEALIQLSDSFFYRSKLMLLLQHDALYKFQVAHQQLDTVLKVLLRLYGGELHMGYMEIREDDIAKLLKVSKKQVIKWLRSLQDYEVIDYQGATSDPQLTFLTPRLDINNLPIDTEKLEWRKKVAMEKLDHVIYYVQSDHKCRTRILQEYFDEQAEDNCGICDFCINKRRSSSSVDPELILKTVSSKSMTITQLAQALGVKEDELLPTLRELMDRDQIRLGPTDVLELI